MTSVKVQWKQFIDALVVFSDFLRTQKKSNIKKHFFTDFNETHFEEPEGKPATKKTNKKSNSCDTLDKGRLKDYHLNHFASLIFGELNDYETCEIDFQTFYKVHFSLSI